MNRKAGMLIVVTAVLVLMMFMAVPGAQAACGDLPAPGVDWSLCNFFGDVFAFEDISGALMNNSGFYGVDFFGADLTGAQMNNSGFYGVDFTGATLVGANMTNASFLVYPATGALTDFTGADLTGADMTGSTAVGSIFSDALIQDLDLTNANATDANFSGAEGIPILNEPTDTANSEGAAASNGTNLAGAVCPTGVVASDVFPYCDWEPLAVTFAGAEANAAPALWPAALAALAALLGLGTLGLWRARRGTVAGS